LATDREPTHDKCGRPWSEHTTPVNDADMMPPECPSPSPDRDPTGTPGWRERLAAVAAHALNVDVRSAAERGYPSRPYYELGAALAADLRAALAASSPGVVTTELLAWAFDRAAGVEFTDDDGNPVGRLPGAHAHALMAVGTLVEAGLLCWGHADMDALLVAAPSPQEGGGGRCACGKTYADCRQMARVAAQCCSRCDAPPPPGVQVDREALKRLSRLHKATPVWHWPGTEGVARFGPPPANADAAPSYSVCLTCHGSTDAGPYQAHPCRTAAALAPLLGTPDADGAS
jgi:hypothetical protein